MAWRPASSRSLVASPRYFAGAITLGVLMQIGAAFCEVTRSLNWFVDNFPRLADWRSHVERVVELEDTFERGRMAGEADDASTLSRAAPDEDGAERAGLPRPAGRPCRRQRR